MPVDWKKYPADWKNIVARIRARSGDRCECSGECGRHECARQPCGAVNHQPHPISGSRVVLTTAHLDHDPSSSDESRMRHLCQRCHLHLDRGLHAQHATQTRLRQREDAGQLRLDVGEVARG
jgi:hypothetical protein